MGGALLPSLRRAFTLDREVPASWLLLSGLTATTAVVSLYAAHNYYGSAFEIRGFIFFLLLSTAAELLQVNMPKGGTVSVGFAIHYVSVLVLSPAYGAVAASLGMVIGDIINRSPTIDRTIFNVGQLVLSCLACGVVFRALGGNILPSDLIGSTVPLLMSATAYFTINVFLVAAAIALMMNQSFWRIWAANFRWAIPNYMALAPLGVLIALIYKTSGVAGTLLLLVPLILARYSFQQYIAMKEAHLGVVQALAAALEAKDSYTKGHSDRVAKYAEGVIEEMGLPENLAETVRYSAEMHDIGKIGTSEQLLNKPGSLTAEELQSIREHANRGAEFLKGIGFLNEVSRNIRYHHEWYDGKGGYPGELAGTDIPTGARILMVCDSFDAMTSDRPYRKRLPVEEAIRRLRAGEGTQFDPAVVEAFLRYLARNPLA